MERMNEMRECRPRHSKEMRISALDIKDVDLQGF